MIALKDRERGRIDVTDEILGNADLSADLTLDERVAAIRDETAWIRGQVEVI